MKWEPLGKLCREMLPRCRHVSVNRDAIESLAKTLADARLPLPAWDHPAFPALAGSTLDAVVWLGNALNFCYWTPDGQPMWSLDIAGEREADAFAQFGMLNAAFAKGHDLNDAKTLKSDLFTSSFATGQGFLPLVDERIGILREIGKILEKNYGGRLENAIAAAGKDALSHAGFLATTFPSFNDARILDEAFIPLRKRAQLAAGMLHAARLARGAQGLSNPQRLTVYADYMLPVALRSLGIMELTHDLAEKISARHWLEAGSREETEIRVVTVAACDILIEKVQHNGAEINALRLDFWLWKKGFDNESKIPHHRTLTTDY